MGLDRTVAFRLATSTRFERAVRGAPGGEAAAFSRASRYVAGTDAASALARARELTGLGAAASVDSFGELVEDVATADRVAAEYGELATALDGLPADVWLAVDLSHLGLDVDRARCRDHLAAVAAALPVGRRIQVGAEDAARADAVLDVVTSVARSGLADRLGGTVQANLRRSPADLAALAAAGVQVRLVKGAYVEPPAVAHRYGEPADLAFLELARQAAELGADFSIATHDGLLREAVLAATGPRPVEQLLGVRPDLIGELTSRGVPVRVYVPYGDSWFRYWMRRVAESRGA